MWLITRYSEYHGIYRYMRSTCWYITWYKPIIGVIYLLSTLWNDMIHSLTLTFKNIFLTYIWHWTFHDLDLFMMRYKRERSKSSSSVVSLSYEVIWMQQPSRLSGGKSPPHPLYHPNFTPTHSLFAQYPLCSSNHPLKFYSPFKSRIYFILTINSLLKTV